MTAILQVVGDSASPTTGDVFVHDILVGMGHTVTYVSDETAENTSGFGGVVICESCVGTTLGAKYDTAAVPVVTHEFAWIDDARLVNTQSIGSGVEGSTISVVASTHPIMDGPYGSFSGSVLVGTVGVTNVYTDTAVVTVASGVTVLAQNPTTAALKYVLACNAGATLTTGTAPAKRAALGWPFSGDEAGYNANGRALMKNAYVWAFGQTVFPTITTTLDNFNRADQTPISGGTLGWTNPMGFPASLPDGLAIISNALTQYTLPAASVTTTTFGPDVEAYYTITAGAAIPINAGFYLWARVQNPGTDNFCAYGVWYNRFSTGEKELTLIRDDNGTDTQLKSAGIDLVTLADGDAIGISCIGNQIAGWYRLSGVWSQISTTATDNTYSTAGPIAVFFEGNAGSVVVDDLKGGTIGAAAAGQPAQGMIQSISRIS